MGVHYNCYIRLMKYDEIRVNREALLPTSDDLWLSPATPPSAPHGHGPVCTLSDIVDILLAYK